MPIKNKIWFLLLLIFMQSGFSMEKISSSVDSFLRFITDGIHWFNGDDVTFAWWIEFEELPEFSEYKGSDKFLLHDKECIEAINAHHKFIIFETCGKKRGDSCYEDDSYEDLYLKKGSESPSEFSLFSDGRESPLPKVMERLCSSLAEKDKQRKDDNDCLLLKKLKHKTFTISVSHEIYKNNDVVSLLLQGEKKQACYLRKLVHAFVKESENAFEKRGNNSTGSSLFVPFTIEHLIGRFLHIALQKERYVSIKKAICIYPSCFNGTSSSLIVLGDYDSLGGDDSKKRLLSPKLLL